jgi:hypothetical protein
LHFGAFAGETVDGKLLDSTLAVLGVLVEIGSSVSWVAYAMTSFAGLRYAGLGYCRLSSCSSVGFAGSSPHRDLMGLLSLVDWRFGVAVDLGLQVPAIAGLDRSRCKTSQLRWLVVARYRLKISPGYF